MRYGSEIDPLRSEFYSVNRRKTASMQFFTAIIQTGLSSDTLISMLISAATIFASFIVWNLFVWIGGTTYCARRVLRAMRLGRVPSSVAFIMDGNRRWARARGRAAYDGHPRGGEKLAEALQWCLDAGIKTVTVYAFSIENFKRPQREIDEIFSLALSRLHEMLQNSDIVQKHRVRVNILGNLDLLPEDLRAACARVMCATSHFTDGPTLNICFAYTSRSEMARAVSQMITLFDRGDIELNDITHYLLRECLFTGYSCGFNDAAVGEPDLLIRTSGERRLSDFLLMQSTNSVIAFTHVLWPDLTAWDMVKMLLDYHVQMQSRLYREWLAKSTLREDNIPFLQRERISKALSRLRLDYFDKINRDASLGEQ